MTDEDIIRLAWENDVGYLKGGRLVNGTHPEADMQDEVVAFGNAILDPMRKAIKAAAVRAGLLHVASTPLTDDELLALLQNVADVAHYARSCHP